jgi:hypothetical protein
MKISHYDIARLLAYGVPDITRVLDCAENRATMIGYGCNPGSVVSLTIRAAAWFTSLVAEPGFLLQWLEWRLTQPAKLPCHGSQQICYGEFRDVYNAAAASLPGRGSVPTCRHSLQWLLRPTARPKGGC